VSGDLSMQACGHPGKLSRELTGEYDNNLEESSPIKSWHSKAALTRRATTDTFHLLAHQNFYIILHILII